MPFLSTVSGAISPRTFPPKPGASCPAGATPAGGRTLRTASSAGRFRDELVLAAAELMRERWRPDPPPEWVTCVPLRAHQVLVPDFAGRLARALGLPFLPVLSQDP